MYSSHGYPYQFGNQQRPPQPPPQQYSAYTPQPATPQHPYPSYPSQPSQQQTGYPHPTPPQQSFPTTPPPQPPAYSPAGQPQPVNMPLLQRSEPDPRRTNEDNVDPRFIMLWSLETEELSILLENEEKFEQMVKNMEEVKQKVLEKEMAMAENRSLAEFNLSREPRLTEGRAQLVARLHEARRLKDSYTVGKTKLDTKKDQHSLDTALALMQAATADAEDESEEVADDFLKGDLLAEDFLDKFMPKRQLSHLRHIKSEKIQELLAEQRRARSTSAGQGTVTHNSTTPPYPHPPYQQSAQGAPPYNYQPQRQAPQPPHPAPRYAPGAPAPTLGAYPQ